MIQEIYKDIRDAERDLAKVSDITSRCLLRGLTNEQVTVSLTYLEHENRIFMSDEGEVFIA